MALISKIREKSTLLLITIGGALVLFVVSDLFDNRNSFLSRGRLMIGEIDGQEIDGREYEGKVNQMVENYKMNTQQKNLDENTQEMIRNQVWEQSIRDIVLGQEMDELGVTVSSEELYDMVQGENPDPTVVSSFTDPQTGKFDPTRVATYLKRMDEDETGSMRDQWIKFEEGLKTDKRVRKYNTLIGKGIFVNSKQAKADYLAKNKKFDALVVGKRYSAVVDSTITVTDEELNKYYEDNKYKYKQKEENRKIEYVVFDIRPSTEDLNKAYEEIAKIKEEFKTTDNDTSLINFYSDNKYQENLLGAGAFLPGFDSLLSAPVGAIAGPVSDNETLKLAKVIAIKNDADSVKARHILLKVENGQSLEKVKSQADSLKKMIQSGASFESLASSISKDPGSAIKGGDLGWFKKGTMVKPFNDACFNGKVGDMPVVVTQFGVHLIEITGRGKETLKRNIGIISKKIEPSNKTYQATFAKADEFAAKSSNEAQFDASVKAANLVPRESDLRENQTNIPGVENAREIIGWAYNHEKGEVSKVFELGKRFVIAKVKEVTPKGFKPMEQVKEDITMNVRKDKKAEGFVKELEGALKGVSDITALAGKIQSPIDSVRALVFSSFQISPNLGREPELVGVITSTSKAGFTKPVVSSQGVWVSYVTKIEEAPATKDFVANATQLKQMYSQRSQFEPYEALKEKANIVDNRLKSAYSGQ
ncbi:MAG: SurA N-terminal domain-containing protein [Bacteroidia bacterium]|nr:SurA N-terminal domain-containing protein [Bacteroidia bacterium]